jgi:hypothetical protein
LRYHLWPSPTFLLPLRFSWGKREEAGGLHGYRGDTQFSFHHLPWGRRCTLLLLHDRRVWRGSRQGVWVVLIETHEQKSTAFQGWESGIVLGSAGFFLANDLTLRQRMMITPAIQIVALELCNPICREKRTQKLSQRGWWPGGQGQADRRGGRPYLSTVEVICPSHPPPSHIHTYTPKRRHVNALTEGYPIQGIGQPSQSKACVSVARPTLPPLLAPPCPFSRMISQAVPIHTIVGCRGPLGHLLAHVGRQATADCGKHLRDDPPQAAPVAPIGG